MLNRIKELKNRIKDKIYGFQKCPNCNGTGMKGEYIPQLGVFADFECPRCNGDGWIDGRRNNYETN